MSRSLLKSLLRFLMANILLILSQKPGFTGFADISETRERDDRPSEEKLELARDEFECGYAVYYWIDPKRYSPVHHRWVKNIIQFLLNDDLWPPGMNQTLPPRVSTLQMKTVLRDRSFRLWAQKDLTDELNRFIIHREALLADKGVQIGDAFFSRPVVKQYFDSRNKIISLLEKRFGVWSTDNGVDCD